MSAQMLALAERLEIRDRRLRTIMANRSLSSDAQAVALSLLVTLDLDIFRDAADALRAAAGRGRS